MKAFEKFKNLWPNWENEEFDVRYGNHATSAQILCQIIDDLEKRVEALEKKKIPKWRTVESLCPNGCARQSTVRKLVGGVVEVVGMVCGHTWQIDPLT